MVGSWYVGRCVSTKIRVAFLPGGMHSSPCVFETLLLRRVKASVLEKKMLLHHKGLVIFFKA